MTAVQRAITAVQKGQLRIFTGSAGNCQGQIFLVLEVDRSDWSFHTVKILRVGEVKPEALWDLYTIATETEVINEAG